MQVNLSSESVTNGYQQEQKASDHSQCQLSHRQGHFFQASANRSKDTSRTHHDQPHQVKSVYLCIVLLLLIFILSGCSAATGVTPTSAADPTATPATSESRIVATTVAITEIADALDLELVGKPTSTKTLPERYKAVPDVGNPMSPDMEKVMSLAPTDILSVTTLQYDLEPKFQGLHLNAEFLNFESLSNMEKEITKLGARFGRVQQAQAVNDQLEGKVKQIKQQVAGKPSPKVLILLGVPGSYLVATEHSYIGDLVRIAGGTNIVSGEKVEYLASNTEYLQQSNPDIILRAAHGMPEEVVKMFDEEFKTNDIWKHFNAVQNGHVYDLPEPLFGTTASLSANEALDELVQMMYPAQ